MSHKHLVEFYEAEATLIDCVADFLFPAFDDGEAVIVVATEKHRSAFDAELEASGVDVEAAYKQGRYLRFDAAETLSKFMVDGRPDSALFRQGVGALITSVQRCAPRVRIYGEMVALLWQDGNQGAALALEDLWNDLTDSYTFDLLCAYPIGLFDLSERSSAFWKVCDQHSSSHLTLVQGEVEQRKQVGEAQTMRDEIGSVKTVIERALRQRMLADGVYGAAAAPSDEAVVYELRSPKQEKQAL